MNLVLFALLKYPSKTIAPPLNEHINSAKVLIQKKTKPEYDHKLNLQWLSIRETKSIEISVKE